MKRVFTFLLVSVSAAMSATAQEIPPARNQSIEEKIGSLEREVTKLKKLKISGYIQGQWQWGQKDASMKVGTANENTEESFGRFGIRRGRVKFTFQESIASAVFQLDITEKGIGIKDAYLNLEDPWLKSMQLKAGILNRPFGYEVGYSSSRRESPERSTVFQALFPDERDLGAMLVLQAPAYSAWNILKLEAGLFAGNGIKQETDNGKDFIGHLAAAKSWGCFSFGAGASYYNGRVYQGTDNVYTMSGNGFSLSANAGKFAKREYIGFDMQLSVKSVIGGTGLNGEYLWGRQPGTADSTKSPNASTLPASDTYIRDFSGGYVMLVQDLGKLPFSLVVKYDWYDPNTEIEGDEIGRNGTTKTDLSRHTWGIGVLYNLNSAVRLTVYYELNRNEKPANVSGYEKDRKDNLLTLRLQYKF